MSIQAKSHCGCFFGLIADKHPQIVRPSRAPRGFAPYNNAGTAVPSLTGNYAGSAKAEYWGHAFSFRAHDHDF